jgi:hypothetical protein
MKSIIFMGYVMLHVTYLGPVAEPHSPWHPQRVKDLLYFFSFSFFLKIENNNNNYKNVDVYDKF